MKVVIDIPDAIYERFGHEYSEQHLISKEVNEFILDAFCNGTPLPKRVDSASEYGCKEVDEILGEKDE